MSLVTGQVRGGKTEPLTSLSAETAAHVRHTVSGMTADDGTSATRHQDNLIELADDLAELDAALLAQLDPVDRARQVRARQALWLYADFTQELYGAAVETCRKAGDPDPDSGDDGAGDVDMWTEQHTATGFAPPAYTLPDRPPVTP
jgi:hypothetical protein